jgi:hypothetical protein
LDNYLLHWLVYHWALCSHHTFHTFLIYYVGRFTASPYLYWGWCGNYLLIEILTSSAVCNICIIHMIHLFPRMMFSIPVCIEPLLLVTTLERCTLKSTGNFQKWYLQHPVGVIWISSTDRW